MLGAIIIDKPAGLTSHDVVARVRRAARTRRVGHAGTLDPFATGVLVCCIGRATRLVQFLVGLDKEYVATVRFGFATDTQDGTGQQITPLRSSKDLSLETLHQALNHFSGPQLQIPPMFSAKKVEGERLYRAARAGLEIKREPVKIVVHAISLLGEAKAGEDGTRDFQLRIRCSSGTYVRTIAHDLGERLGLGGHLVDLRRTEVGHFGIADSVTLEELETTSEDELGKFMISTANMLSHLPTTILDDQGMKLVTSGRGFALSEEDQPPSQEVYVRLCDREGHLVAVGERDPLSRLVRPRVVMGVDDM